MYIQNYIEQRVVPAAASGRRCRRPRVATSWPSAALFNSVRSERVYLFCSARSETSSACRDPNDPTKSSNILVAKKAEEIRVELEFMSNIHRN
jgi:hypothetical protein